MNLLFQTMVVLVVFGPLIIGTIIWHILWNNRSGPSSDPPSGGGPKRRPVPPPPKLSGDRPSRRPRPLRQAPSRPVVARVPRSGA